LQSHIDKGYSAWTVKKEAAALAKLYHCRTTDFKVELPARHREEIERSRDTKTTIGSLAKRGIETLSSFQKLLG